MSETLQDRLGTRLHPLTCGGDRMDDAHRAYQAEHGGDFGELVVTADGWACPVPGCGYTQSFSPASPTLRLREVEAERDALKDGMDRLAVDAMCELSAVGICTPVEGFVQAPYTLRSCIRTLAKERDAALARAEAAEALVASRGDMQDMHADARAVQAGKVAFQRALEDVFPAQMDDENVVHLEPVDLDRALEHALAVALKTARGSA